MFRATHFALLSLAAGAALAADSASEYNEENPWHNQGWNASPVIREICGGGVSWDRCLAAAESTFLSAHPEVRKHDERLVINLENGRNVVFEGSLAYGQFTYLGTIDPLRFHLVMFYEEDIHYHPVGRASGWQTTINAYPVVSPDRAWLATACLDLERGDFPNRVQIWAVEGDTLRSDYILDGREAAHPDTSVWRWGPQHPRWIDSNTLVFDVRVLRDRNQWVGFPADSMAVRHGPDGWVRIDRFPTK